MQSSVHMPEKAACSADKASLRKTALSLRDSMTAESRARKDSLIRHRLHDLAAFKTARTVLLFASFRSEVDTFGLLADSLAAGKLTVLPRVDKDRRDMTLYAVVSAGELVQGYFGILEPPPSAEREIRPDKLDLVIVPGAAFDLTGNRLGYGKGFYDKLLRNRHCPAVALAYEEQIVATVPCEPHDVRVDMIITDTRVVDCHGQSKD